MTAPLIVDPIERAGGGLRCPRCRSTVTTLWITKGGALVCGRCRPVGLVRA
jgi:hypothetical protein